MELIADRTPRSFWRSWPGLALRWTLYIPLGLLALAFAEGLALALFKYIFRDFRDVFVIGFLFGGLIVVPVFAVAFLYLVKVVAWVCPSPRVGMIVFTVFGTVHQLFVILSAFTQDTWGLSVVVGLTGVACGTLLIGGTVAIWADSKPKEV